jgi:DNA-binding transcriptional LysR family regulator
MDLDLRAVRYFVAVAEELHFGRAAARLHISQPALSKQVQRLERQLGGPLLVRGSRHVSLTPRGETFLADARELLGVADRMTPRPDGNLVRIAHIFELSTSRVVADAYARARPEVRLVQHAMDSITQLRALHDNRLDVAVVRVTPQLLVERPSGWSHTLLRLEPMRLIGRPGDRPAAHVSLHERPVDVFGDDRSSGLYNAYGNYLSAFEQQAGLTMRWLGTPGAFSHCYPAWTRASGAGRLLEFDSYARRYAERGLPVHVPLEVQPHYPWSLAWRTGRLDEAVADFLDIAHRTADAQGWRSFEEGSTAPWLPADDPVAQQLGLAIPLQASSPDATPEPTTPLR